MGFSGSCGYATNLFAELTTMLQGLKLVCESGLKDVICEIDSMELIRLIAQDNSHSHPYAAIKEFKVHSWNIQFSHSPGG